MSRHSVDQKIIWESSWVFNDIQWNRIAFFGLPNRVAEVLPASFLARPDWRSGNTEDKMDALGNDLSNLTSLL